MSEARRIARQLKNGFEGNAWHGPGLLQVLERVDAKSAAAKPIPGAHSIWEIVLHLTGTQQELLLRLDGSTTNLPPEVDWPPVMDPSEAEWAKTLDLLRSQEQQYQAAVKSFADEKLEAPFLPEGASAYDTFHGHVQHNIYHAGQIVLLKKAQAL